ncbi:eukaryotic translation initiation factor 4E binding protein 3 [Chelydra serpentina]|uniref:Eukaryotic translation initiation factor 4E binding protein 3 n=1 Tax=Chelydra serpentina TaxID=8475 RepID=A0A8T1S6B2_CHESE|nr:eukaryotic translation initiation factor 4E binding protein 3 [Chelydra serpentina]
MAAVSTTSSCPIPGGRDLGSPDSYSCTPGGTLYSTIPGGTRIIYDCKFLLECKNSPIARTLPCYLPHIPGITCPVPPPTRRTPSWRILRNKVRRRKRSQMTISLPWISELPATPPADNELLSWGS